MNQILPDGNLASDNAEVDDISSIFSLLFAQEEAKRFNSLAFERWTNHCQNTIKPTKRNWQFLVTKDEHVASWLECQAQSAPLWTALSQPGPWDTDSRKPFIMKALELISATPLSIFQQLFL